MLQAKLKAAVLALCASAAFSANASLLDPHEYQDGTLSWLALSETVGLSINDILSGKGGWNTRYRFATRTELDGLLDSFKVTNEDYAQYPIGHITGLLNAIGGSTPDGNIGTWSDGRGYAGARGQTLDEWVSLEVTSGDDPQLSPNCPSYVVCARSDVLHGSGGGGQYTGNFLVRLADVEPPVDVPEPSSLALLGLAGALAASRLRKPRK
jgi:hypothetical protein